MACGGSNTEICGGSSRFSMYVIKNYVTPSTPQTFAGYSYAGCYTESTIGRALTSSSSTNYNSMTLNTCATFCKGYSMWGIEYGGEVSCFPTPAISKWPPANMMVVSLRQYPRGWKCPRSWRRQRLLNDLSRELHPACLRRITEI